MDDRARKRRVHQARLFVLLAVGLALAGCGRSSEGGARLFDGSSAPEVPRALADLEARIVMTRVSTVPAKALASAVRSCAPDVRVPAEATVVRRIGPGSESLTFLGRSPGDLRACDAASGATHADGGRWCARAVGLLTAGTLDDPRLAFCADRTGRVVAAFAWLVPLSGARWIAVGRRSRREVYEVAGRLPVRVVTVRDIDLRSSSAIFDVVQYGPDGRLLGRAAVRPHVSG